MSDTQTGGISPEEDSSRNTDLSVDVADGSSSPNETTESAPTLSLDEE